MNLVQLFLVSEQWGPLFRQRHQLQQRIRLVQRADALRTPTCKTTTCCCKGNSALPPIPTFSKLNIPFTYLLEYNLQIVSDKVQNFKSELSRDLKNSVLKIRVAENLRQIKTKGQKCFKSENRISPSRNLRVISWPRSPRNGSTPWTSRSYCCSLSETRLVVNAESSSGDVYKWRHTHFRRDRVNEFESIKHY